MVRTTELAIASLLLSGCATVSETHYFRTDDSATDSSNYYRVSINARGRATKIRYLAGFFDERAVEQYFSEFTQPSNLDAVVGSGDDARPGSGSQTLEPIDPKLQGRSLVLLLSTNVDEVAAQLGALAENIQVQAALTAMVRQDEVKETKRARKEAELDRQRAARLSAVLRQAKATLEDGAASPADKDAARMRAANALATYLGASERFADTAEAATWLDENRARVQGETQ